MEVLLAHGACINMKNAVSIHGNILMQLFTREQPYNDITKQKLHGGKDRVIFCKINFILSVAEVNKRLKCT